MRRARMISTIGLLCVLTCGVTPTVSAAQTTTSTYPISLSARATDRGTHQRIVLRAPAQLIGVAGLTDGHVSVRIVNRLSGGAGPWVKLAAAHHDAPDPGSSEGRRSNAASTAVWVGSAAAIDVRRGTDARGALRLIAVHDSQQASDLAGPSARTVWHGGIRPRSTWRAAPAKVTPEITKQLRGAVVHHTVSVNAYACSAVPSMLRTMQRYHMVTNGWNDLGYNVLIDRCGNAWEGRGGGVRNNVVGAHTAGFNTDTFGVALIGTHSSSRPTSRARAKLVRVLAWRLDHAHVHPGRYMQLTARSGDKYPLGSRVWTRAVSGHRNLFPTECPGNALYSGLGSVAQRAWNLGAAKIANVMFTPSIDPLTGSLTSLRVRGVSSPTTTRVTWQLQRMSTGAVIRSRITTAHTIDATMTLSNNTPAWDVRLVATPYAGTSGGRAFTAPIVSSDGRPNLVMDSVTPASVELGGDPLSDRLTVAFTLQSAATMGVWLDDPTTNAQLAILRAPQQLVGTTSPRNWLVSLPPDLAPGSYYVRVGASSDPVPMRSMLRTLVTVTQAP